MQKYKVEGTYRADRGHENAAATPHKFSFEITALDKTDARMVTENQIRNSDDKFDSIREFTATEIIVPDVEEPVIE